MSRWKQLRSRRSDRFRGQPVRTISDRLSLLSVLDTYIRITSYKVWYIAPTAEHNGQSAFFFARSSQAFGSIVLE